MQGAKIKTIIVDDESLARKRIAQLLAPETDLEIVAECADGLAAISAVGEHEPDLMFLDVEMPELSGFDVLREINPKTMPAVVFVTAYDQYTIQAFDAHAVDYLLKPFSEERFRQAVSRTRQRIEAKKGNRAVDPSLSRLLDLFKPDKNFLERLIVNHKNRLIIVLVDEIDWVESYGNYLKIHAGGNTYLLRETMNDLAARVDPEKFIRIHRSTLVNVERIRELQPMFGGQYSVILRNGTELTLSRNYRKTVLEIFQV
jgi:two-component system, LytTR family, response regulator